VIAVIGGLFRLEGAWVGALLFVILDNETRGVDWIGGRFNTVIGSIFFVIVLLSPGGLLGIWETLRRLPARLRAREPSAAEQPGA
jgi:branched-chain amino acid transport system permease protein